MAAIYWSLTATEDLQAIEEFVARDSPVYAIRLTDRIVEVVERLEDFPLSGRVVPEFVREDLRELIVGSYRVVYLVEEDSVTILRVVHGAQDLVGVAEQAPWDTIE